MSGATDQEAGSRWIPGPPSAVKTDFTVTPGARVPVGGFLRNLTGRSSWPHSWKEKPGLTGESPKERFFRSVASKERPAVAWPVLNVAGASVNSRSGRVGEDHWVESY